MPSSWPPLAIGSRSSPLALAQTRLLLERYRQELPALAWRIEAVSSPGDRDRVSDLRSAPADFFTRDLDEAVLSGRLDGAVHSAKDLPEVLAPGLDGFWAPWGEDARDCLVLRAGATLGAGCTIGISSQRREDFCQTRWPGCVVKPIRGTIEGRLEQLDRGDYDAVIMAGAALIRLGLQARIAQWFSLEELPVPDGQGRLAITFRAGDRRFLALRDLGVRAVTVVGAGSRDGGSLTLAGREALARAEVCLHDLLLDAGVLRHVPPGCRCIPVGKRAGGHLCDQAGINELLLRHAKRGARVVRLKGGDPGLFGRLGEELATLAEAGLPWRILPGVSSLVAATTGTGLLLTRREVAGGFTALTPRRAGGAVDGFDAATRARLPLVLFMAIESLATVAAQLQAEGWSADTPAAVVFGAGGADETLIEATLADLAARAAAGRPGEEPGIAIIGAVAGLRDRMRFGPLRGARVLITAGAETAAHLAAAVHDAGGRAVELPLIRVQARPGLGAAVAGLGRDDWVLVPSPAAARVLLDAARPLGLNRLPRLLACGPGTIAVLAAAGVQADLAPAGDFSADGLVAAAQALSRGARVLRLRSDRAGEDLTRRLRDLGLRCDDCPAYETVPLRPGRLPPSEAVVFASPSAVEACAADAGLAALGDRTVVAIGRPTAETLQRLGRPADLVAAESSAAGCIAALVARAVARTYPETP